MRRGAASAPRRRSLRAASLAVVIALLGSQALSAALIPAVARAEPLTDRSVTVTVLGLSPTTPAVSPKPQKLTVSLRLTNTTDQSLDTVRVVGERGDPISSQSALEAAIAHPTAPDPTLVAPIAPVGGTPVTASLGPRDSTTVTFTTTTGTVNGEVGVCLCENRIYPLYFTVHYVDSGGAETVLGSAQTYVPSFDAPVPQPMRVSWVWPIMDRPHRLSNDSVFLNDDLTTSVTRGRLNRVLAVAEAVSGTVPLTLVIDPELIDELQVMSGGKYQVADEAGKAIKPGTGGPAAAAWLQRLRTLLDQHPSLELEFTPFADPDVETLTRNGLPWTMAMSAAAADRVKAALGGRVPTSQLSWPVGETLSSPTLEAVRGNGASTVVLNDRSLPAGDNPEADALAPLQTTTGPVTAAVTSSTIQRYVASTLSIGGAGAADLPKLTAEVAIRAAVDPTRSHYVVITAPRYIDPSVDIAVRAIRNTANTSWSTPVTILGAEGVVTPIDRGRLVTPKATSAALPILTIDTVRQVIERRPALLSMLVAPDATAAAVLLNNLPVAVQRAESAAWLSAPLAGVTFAEALGHALDSLESGVFILKPLSGTYTLASSNSALPVTIWNTLDVAVRVRLRITAVNDLPGFSAKDIGLSEVAPGQKLQVRIPTDVQRSGRFQVQAQLYTPNGAELGQTVALSVHSTALGTIGIVITVVAAAILILALLVRFVRRLRDRGGPVAVEERTPAAVP